MTKRILINDIGKVKEFVTHAMKCRRDVTAVSGKYRVDGRSIMGLLSLNLSEPIVIEYDEDDCELIDVLVGKFYVR